MLRGRVRAPAVREALHCEEGAQLRVEAARVAVQQHGGAWAWWPRQARDVLCAGTLCVETIPKCHQTFSQCVTFCTETLQRLLGMPNR